jgi:SAM-dependent methyltransferase
MKASIERFNRFRSSPRERAAKAVRWRVARLPVPVGRRVAASMYVGSPRAGGEIQFQILRLEGLRPESHVLEIGCGALNASLPIIRFLSPAHYVGIDPNAWLRETQLTKWRVRRLINGKQPLFLNREDFDASETGRQFDYILSHSVLSHAARAQLDQFLRNCARVLAPKGRVLASLRFAEGNNYGSSGSRDGKDSRDDEWVYPGASYFESSTIEAAAASVGLEVEVKPQYTARMTARCPTEVHDWLVLTHVASPADVCDGATG